MFILNDINQQLSRTPLALQGKQPTIFSTAQGGITYRAECPSHGPATFLSWLPGTVHRICLWTAPSIVRDHLELGQVNPKSSGSPYFSRKVMGAMWHLHTLVPLSNYPNYTVGPGASSISSYSHLLLHAAEGSGGNNLGRFPNPSVPDVESCFVRAGSVSPSC